MTRKRALVVCPGRGSYNAAELGYLARHHRTKTSILTAANAVRDPLGQTPLADLDEAAAFSRRKHASGENASALIHACAWGDWQDIDRSRYEIVGVTGNSMGWYTALATAGVLAVQDAFKLVNTMGTFMAERATGGQLIYPVVDQEWRESSDQLASVQTALATIPDLYLSISLGGLVVLAGSDAAISAAKGTMPSIAGRFPLLLDFHAAYHTPLMAPIAREGSARLPADMFSGPDVPLVDGRGHVWYPFASDPAELHAYTLGHQVTETYHFDRAILTASRELAPDVLILLGPGDSLRATIRQSMMSGGFLPASRAEADGVVPDPVICMGDEGQRASAATATPDQT